MKLRWWMVGYILALVVALFAPLASGEPDGLERIAEDKGFIEEAEDAHYEVIADYAFPGIDNEEMATILGGWTGVTVLFLLVGGGAYLARRRTPDDSEHPA